ncbi:hypothetical protein [Vibrio mexicanus]|uniref:hypothetical protein n=1 Tax=Vibrio mexicanus TaxID=1004326 RepID=UPI00063C6720|nr:hypothetical protein [Vibrio mexicanus]
MKNRVLPSFHISLFVSSLLCTSAADAKDYKSNLLLINARSIATDIAVIEENSHYHIHADNIGHFIKTNLSLNLNRHRHFGDQAIFYIEETDLDVNCHIVVDFAPVPNSQSLHKTVNVLTDGCQFRQHDR